MPDPIPRYICIAHTIGSICLYICIADTVRQNDTGNGTPFMRSLRVRRSIILRDRRKEDCKHAYIFVCYDRHENRGTAVDGVLLFQRSAKTDTVTAQRIHGVFPRSAYTQPEFFHVACAYIAGFFPCSVHVYSRSFSLWHGRRR